MDLSLLIVSGLSGVTALAVLAKTVKIVQHKHAYNILRLGRFSKTIGEGISFVIPFVDSVHSQVSLQEEVINTAPQTVITSDSIEVVVDGIMCIKVLDPYKAAFNIDNYVYAIEQVAQSTLRDVIGKMVLGDVFSQRAETNRKVIEAVNEASGEWGVQLMRYELKKVEPPKNILVAMEKQVTAEREKIALITKSEGEKEAVINLAGGKKESMILDAEGIKAAKILDAEGLKEAKILEAEAQKCVLVLDAQGQAESVIALADAECSALERVGSQGLTDGGKIAMKYKLAMDAVAARVALAHKGTTVITSENSSSVGNVMAEAVAVSTAMKGVDL
ncbi:SPFH domain-containing protein [Photobacterium damselae]|uniref:SPFH domain-containing protein n=1 Tax=Photobacterium damselae TaxID=38293 RepID=UPI004069422B